MNDNEEIVIGFDIEELIEESFGSLFHRCKVDLEQSMKSG